jgi:uncharacterized cupredoxin-like copper-binding protein
VRRAGRTALAVGIIAALLIAGLSPSSLTREASASSIVESSSTITVTATNTFGFSPNNLGGLPTNTSMTLDFINGDTNGLTHTFTLLGCPDIIVPRAGKNAFNVSAFVNGPKCGAPRLNIVPAAESSKSVAFTTPANNSWYEFICTEAGHYQSGMYGFLAFGTAVVPANYSILSGTPGAGLAVFIIVGTIVTLTVIAIVLGFVVGRRDGSVHEMPPERLGYGEPGSPPLPNTKTPPPPHS